MERYGLIGYPLGHSFSQGYFKKKFKTEGLTESEYKNYPLEDISHFPALIANEPELKGLNVTIPYKQQVMKYLDEIDDEAKEIGAVNTIKINRNSNGIILKGYNTDVFGFEAPLLKVIKPWHKSALILGTGGASKAVAYILDKHDIEVNYVSRIPKHDDMFSYENITPELIEERKIIVNCSPLGMYPNVKECPNLPYCSLSNKHILYDLVYNPELTRFLKKGKKKKATLINGLPMLHVQAEKAWEIWNL